VAEALEYCHERGVKVYVTINIYARENDFKSLPQYLKDIEKIGVDAVLVSDPGIIEMIHLYAPSLIIHLSTQANTTNSMAVRFWAKQGVKRIVLARETRLDEITEITRVAKEIGVETEAFVHGAMCISYSGRCLMSDYFTGRGGNRGACVQACRWEWKITEVNKEEKPLIMQEDNRGTYLLNSKDLNMIEHIPDLMHCGIDSFKVEGRMKSPYYVATVINAYRRAIDSYIENGDSYDSDGILYEELLKAGHREYTTGFYYTNDETRQCYNSSRAIMETEFMAVVKSYDKDSKTAVIEMRNRFREGDILEILSPGEAFNKRIVIENMTDLNGIHVPDAKRVQQLLRINCEYRVFENDILRSVKLDG
jgi:Collagenase and related proteases